jgi:hypothetical protein
MKDSANKSSRPKHRLRKRRLQFGLLGLLLVTALPVPALAWGQALRETWTQWRMVDELKRRCGDSIKVSVEWVREPENEFTALLGQQRVVEISLVGFQSVPMESRHLSKDVLELLGQFPYVESLVLEQVHVDFEGMRALGKAESIGWLKAHQCEFEDGEFPAVAELRNLVSLDFTGSMVGDETVQVLVKLPRLRSVDLRGGYVSGESIDLLRQSSHIGFAATPEGIVSAEISTREDNSWRCCRTNNRNCFCE